MMAARHGTERMKTARHAIERMTAARRGTEPTKVRAGLVAVALSAACPAAIAAAQADCQWGPRCPYSVFGDEVGHYQIQFAAPLIRLPPAGVDGRRDGAAAGADAGADAIRRESFSSADGGFQLDAWAVPNTSRRRTLDRPPAPGSENEDGWRVTYRAGGDTWTVSTGYTKTGLVFYERRDLMCGGKTLTGFVILYRADPASRASFDKWVGRTKVRAHRCGP